MNDNSTTSGVVKKKRRPSLGARKNPIDQVSEANSKLALVQDFIDKDERDMAYITPDSIRKSFNARFIPCSLDEFAAIEWPSLDLSVDEAKDSYPALLHDRQFFVLLSDSEKADFLEFLSEIHATAKTMVEEIQVHPITLERESAESTEYFIVDGERRTLSVLYTKGKIPVVKAFVYNRLLSDIERAKLKDIANLSKPLSTHETFLSKKAIYDAFEGAKDLGVRDLGNLLGYKKDTARIMKKVFEHPHENRLMERVKKEKLSFRKIVFLLEHGVDAEFLDESDHKLQDRQSVSDSQTDKEKTKPNVDIEKFQEKLSEMVGFPCVIKFNESSQNINLHFKSNLSNFEDLLENLTRLNVGQVMDN